MEKILNFYEVSLIVKCVDYGEYIYGEVSTPAVSEELEKIKLLLKKKYLKY